MSKSGKLDKVERKTRLFKEIMGFPIFLTLNCLVEYSFLMDIEILKLK